MLVLRFVCTSWQSKAEFVEGRRKWFACFGPASAQLWHMCTMDAWSVFLAVPKGFWLPFRRSWPPFHMRLDGCNCLSREGMPASLF